MFRNLHPLVRRACALATIAAGLTIAGPLLSDDAVRAAEQSFPAWLADLRQDARANGISSRIFDTAFAGIEPIPRVIELDRRQPEGTMTFAEYRSRVVSEKRVEEGRRMLQENAALLEEIQGRYGVPARFIVALWGVETSYGRVTGNFPVVGALATLAYEGRRAAFFRGELMNALRILQQGHITPDEMRGSWAGAMGQSQFMPSSFLRFAVDYDGDGRRDIWGTRADVFASIANYLASSGWVTGLTWGREVRVPPGIAVGGADDRRPLAEWARRGVVQVDGSPLPVADVDAGLVAPDRDRPSPIFAVYENYRVLLRWNRSNYFGLAVSEIADRIVAP